VVSFRHTDAPANQPMSEIALYQMQFLKALGLAVAIETAVLFLAIRYAFGIGRRVLPNALLAFAGILCSSTTLPYLWFVLPVFLKTRLVLGLVGEPAIVLVEAVFYYFVLRIGVKRSLLVSFVCNLASFMGGMLIM
jgi:hypothetical protein